MKDLAAATEGGGPLTNIKVLELGSMLAGPFVGSMLGDFGAEVIKVEKPGRPDALREWPPFKDGQALWWKTMSRNKMTITLDISRPESREIVLRLVGRSDVVIENFRPGTLERWGFDPSIIADTYPHVVWVRVSGYGQSGPYSGKGGYATIAEAFSGLASFTGFADRGPMVSSFPMGDYLAGIFGAFGTLAAIVERQDSHRGQVVDVSLFEPLLRIIESAIVRFDQTGAKKPLLGNQMEEDVPRNIYRTADGEYIAISVGSQSLFNALLNAIGRPELRTDPRFASLDARVANRDVIDALVRDWMAAQTAGEALRIMDQYRLVVGKVNDMGDVFSDPHVTARGAVAQVVDPDLGPYRTAAPVPKLSRTPGAIRWTGRSAGADNERVFRELLGMTEVEIRQLRESGAI